MIATRQRKQKKGSLLPILLPFAAIVMLIGALTWPPSRNFIANGPLHPLVDVLDSVWGTVSRPLTFAYQQQQITDRNVQIQQLNQKLEADRKAADFKDAQVASLQKQINDIQNQAAAEPSPTAAPAAAGASGGAVGAMASSYVALWRMPLNRPPPAAIWACNTGSIRSPNRQSAWPTIPAAARKLRDSLASARAATNSVSPTGRISSRPSLR